MKTYLNIFFLFTSQFLSIDVKFTHPSNEVSQDYIVMFKGPLVLMGLKMNDKKHKLVLF